MGIGPAAQGCLIRSVVGAALGTACGAIVTYLALWLASGDHGIPHRLFDRAEWLDAEHSRDGDSFGYTPRQAMSRDLLAHLRPGQTRAEVRGLLGEPSAWPLFLGSDWFGPEDEAWWLGDGDGPLNHEDEWLYLYFGQDDRLLRARIVDARASRKQAP